MALGADNHYATEHAKHALAAPISVLLLWVLACLFSGFFDFLRHRRVAGPGPAAAPAAGAGVGPGYNNYNAAPAGAAGAGVAGRGSFDDFAHRTTKALRDLFIWIFSAWVLNYVINGFTRGLTILIIVTAALGIVWAMLKKPLHKFADILLLALFPLLLVLFIVPLQDGWFATDRHIL